MKQINFKLEDAEAEQFNATFKHGEKGKFLIEVAKKRISEVKPNEKPL